jgi:hypothetical protein
MRLLILFVFLLAPLKADLPELGSSLTRIYRNLGEPDRTREDEKGFILLDYFSEGLVLVLGNNHLQHIVIQKNSENRSTEGLALGDKMSDLISLYGPLKDEKEVEPWFGGTEAGVPYRHKTTKHLKVNLPQKNLVVFLNPKGIVTSMVLGYLPPSSKK